MSRSEDLYIIDKYAIVKKPRLNTSLTVASAVNSYSIGVQYIREWFLSKFPKDYFKSINIEGRHTFYDFRKMSREELLKRIKPALSITPRLQFDHTREEIDSYPYGADMFLKANCNFEEAFFKDPNKNLYLGFVSELMVIDFDFRVKVSTRAQQIDLYKYMQLNMRIGYTQGEYLSLDYHVPYSTMLQIAKDAGFTIVDDKIKDVVSFVKYFNTHSLIPLTYKLRTINGNDEFFLRIDNIYAHINCGEPLSADDGDKEGMINTSFIIEMSCKFSLPCPKFYVYFSNTKHIIMETRNKVEDVFGVYDIKTFDVPETNDKGWNQIITTEYFEESADLNGPLTIDFSDFFRNSELGDIIDYNNSIALSSSICLDILLHNDGRNIEYEMDWRSLILRTKESVARDITYIVIYADMEYINNIILNRSNAFTDRLERE